MLKIDIEDLLSLAGADTMVVCFGNRNKDDPYLELVLNDSLSKDGRVRYAIKEPSPTGEIVSNMASPLFAGACIKDIEANRQKIAAEVIEEPWIEK